MSMEHEQSDRALLRDVISGSIAGFDKLYERHATPVTRYAWGLASTRESAQELVQDTFVTLWRKSDKIDLVGESLLPWLLVTTKNFAANQRRSELRAARVVTALMKQQPNQADTSKNDMVQWVLEAINALPPIDREVCVLCLLQGFTYREAGRQLNLTESAVGKRLERSRAAIREVRTNEQ